MSWLRSGRGLEAILQVVDVGLRYSLLAGAGLASAFGQFLLALLLVAVAAGLFLRAWRGKRARKMRRPDSV